MSLVQVCRTDGEIPSRVGAFRPKQQHLPGSPQDQRVHRIRSQHKVSEECWFGFQANTALQGQLNNVSFFGGRGARRHPGKGADQFTAPDHDWRHTARRRTAGARSTSGGVHAATHSHPKKNMPLLLAGHGRNKLKERHQANLKILYYIIRILPYISHICNISSKTDVNQL